MKAIEKISQKLEKVILKGLEIAEASTEIRLYQTDIILYLVVGSIFVYFKHNKGTSGNEMVNIYEIGSNESYYLYDTISSILEDIRGFGEEGDRDTALKVYNSVIEFCKKVGFKAESFEEAVEKLK